ncbi:MULTISPECIES: xanthine dehydrogenase family protein molybdopterin-binding subunit [unclassified Beijerinckia]|uniref:xanthine dehydrogenase family protein molybdopterin-binding subunit n=1 Tax=unclassified Beijerinckia TaxID=2638183 RepID=UPI000896E44B|nr:MULTISPECIES: xanthine dehydrogenase family protein molybdopterin-binding subunit [unclassified Beijerinckia]MDH7799257.1 carbon-monoxide dehydrogenase large subunit [Beijerinckia sp. GAS462]SED90531.1 carbon-monoxide dehydrogenase large subunit [Beijerinckia sp. 28-YEA-48]
MIGKRNLRKEDNRLLRGKGQFVDDYTPANCLYMALVRSPHPSARIVSASSEAALEQGAHSVWFFHDLPTLAESLPLFREPATNPYCDLMRPPPQLALADGVVRYVGEPVAAVLASTPAGAVDAAEAVEIDYEPTDPVVDPVFAMSDERRVHEGQSNIVAHLAANIGDIDAAFANGDVVLSEHFVYPRITSVPIETRGVSAEYESARSSLTIRIGHQLPYTVRSAVARFTGLREEDIVVLCPDTGGAFGPKSGLYSEDILAPLLAKTVNRPVKWIQTRSEFMLSSQHARDQIIEARVAARADGTLLGLDVKLLKDTGAYLCWAVIEPTNTINHIPSQYVLPAYRAEAHSVLTNKVPSAPYRGTGRPEATWVMERCLDLLAIKLNIDPIEIRRRNLIPASAIPYKPGNVYRDGVEVTYDSNDFPLVFNETVAAVDVEHWRARQRECLSGQKRRIGIGVANYMEAGGIGWPCEGATVKIDEAGRAEVMIGVSQSGQGHETVFAQICADLLSLPFENVRVLGGDSRLLPYGFGTGGSRVTVNTGNAVALAAKDVRRRIQLVAGKLLGCESDQVQIENGEVFAADDRQKVAAWPTIAATAAFSRILATEGTPGLCSTQYFYPSTVTWASGTHAAVVELDLETGTWKILKYAIGHDCGRQINPTLVEGQVMGSFAQGLGIAMGEKIIYSPEGQLVTGTLMDYVMPHARDIPELILKHFEFPATTNPLGVRGVGEGNVGPVAAAIAGAITDALGGHIAIREPMMTPPTVRELMRQGQI